MERDCGGQRAHGAGRISIHTLRMERDVLRPSVLQYLPHFNPHAPHGA